MAYATADQYRQAKEKSRNTGSDDNASINESLEAASTRIDIYTRRSFLQTSAQTETFEPKGDGGRLYIGDWSSITSVTIDDEAVTSPILRKQDHISHISSFPYSFIEIPKSSEEVVIVGNKGWASVPEAIKTCCIELAAIFRLQTPRAMVAYSTTGRTVPISISQAANEILYDYLNGYYLDVEAVEVYCG